MSEKANTGGRPIERDQAKRAAVALRTTPAIKGRLQSAADTRGRSITQEVEHRIERSFETDDLFGGQHNVRLLVLLAAEIRRAEHATGKAWNDDTATHAAAAKLVAEAMDRAGPPPENFARSHELVAQYLDKKARRDELVRDLMERRVLRSGTTLGQLARRGSHRSSYFASPPSDWLAPDGGQLAPGDQRLLEDALQELEVLELEIADLFKELQPFMQSHWDAQKRGADIHRALTQTSIEGN